MIEEHLNVTISALDPAQSLSDLAIDELYPRERLESRVAALLHEPETDSVTIRRTRARRHPFAIASAAAIAAAIVTTLTFVSLPTRQVATSHSQRPEVGQTIRGLRTGAANNNATTFAGAYVTYSPFGLPECRAKQILISLTNIKSNASPGSGWSGIFWFYNKGPSCQMPRVDLELQPVRGTKWQTVGPASPSDAVARSAIALRAGSTAYSNASIGPTDIAAPQHSNGTIAKYCSVVQATGLILTGIELHWPDEYFKLGRPISVCTRWYLNVSGGLLTPAAIRDR